MSSTMLWCFNAKRSARAWMVASSPSGRPRIASSNRYCCGSRPAARATASPSPTNLRMRYRSSASAWYSAEVISFAIGKAYRNAIYCASFSPGVILEVATWEFSLGSKRFAGHQWHSCTLQRFAKGLLRLVVLVAVPFVKLVRALANHVRSHGHALAAVLSRPIFRGCQQPRARSGASLPFGHDEAVHLGAYLHFQKRFSTHMHPADDSVLCGFRHKNSMLRDGFDSAQSFAHLGRGCRIPKLPTELRNPLRIGALRASNLQFVLACCCHLLQAGFRRNRACTASLFSSRSASAAIHLAAREFCLRIFSASRMAARFSRTFLFPMFRKAQFTAFLTKFRASWASREIIGSSRKNFACTAVLSRYARYAISANPARLMNSSLRPLHSNRLLPSGCRENKQVAAGPVANIPVIEIAHPAIHLFRCDLLCDVDHSCQDPRVVHARFPQLQRQFVVPPDSARQFIHLRLCNSVYDLRANPVPRHAVNISLFSQRAQLAQRVRTIPLLFRNLPDGTSPRRFCRSRGGS